MNKLLYDRAFSIFCRLLKLSVDNGQEYSCLCQNAVFEVVRNLKSEEMTADECEKVAFLIAVVAIEKYYLLTFASDPSQSQALGDAKITLNPSLSLEAVKKLKKDALESCNGLLKKANCVLKMM